MKVSYPLNVLVLVSFNYFVFLQLKIHLKRERFEDMEDIKRTTTEEKSFIGALINGNFFRN